MKLRGEGKTIVLADDAPEVVDLVRMVLEQRGYEILSYSNGLAAWDKIQDNEPELIILDILMPGMNGLELCAAIKSSETLSNIPVVMITSATDNSEVPDGFWSIGTESDDFLSKPFNPLELAARVDSLVFGTALPAEFQSRGGGGGAQRVIFE